MMNLLLSSVAALAGGAAAVNLTVASTGGSPVSPLQYGLIFEDISHSGDGGIYAELVQNRAFQNGTIPPWQSVNGASLTLTTDEPLSSALPYSINVAGTSAPAGLVNPGYWGINVAPQTYNGSFFARGDYNGSFTVSLQSNLTGDVYATATVAGPSTSASWTQFNYTLVPNVTAPNSNNSLSITFDPTMASNGSLDFNLLSLFPPTYNNRPNGMRIDLMEILGAQPPSFLRLPGGNNLEGSE